MGEGHDRNLLVGKVQPIPTTILCLSRKEIEKYWLARNIIIVYCVLNSEQEEWFSMDHEVKDIQKN